MRTVLAVLARSVSAVVLVGLVGLAGCAGSGSCARCGWYAGVIKPPTVETHGTVLVSQGAPLFGAMPLGQLTGPVAGPVPVEMRQLPLPRLTGPCESPTRSTAPYHDLPAPKEAPSKGREPGCPQQEE